MPTRRTSMFRSRPHLPHSPRTSAFFRGLDISSILRRSADSVLGHDADDFIPVGRTPETDRELATLHPLCLWNPASPFELPEPGGIALDFTRHLGQSEIVLVLLRLEV